MPNEHACAVLQMVTRRMRDEHPVAGERRAFEAWLARQPTPLTPADIPDPADEELREAARLAEERAKHESGAYERWVLAYGGPPSAAEWDAIPATRAPATLRRLTEEEKQRHCDRAAYCREHGHLPGRDVVPPSFVGGGRRP